MKIFKPSQGLPLFRRKKFLIALFTLIFISIPIALLSLQSARQASAWWDDTWKYRKSIVFNNSGAEVNNQKVKLDIDTSTLITATKLQADCDDMRFTDANGQLLPYFLDSSGGACNTISTDFYVLMDTIVTKDNLLYMYYGNTTATTGTQASQFSESTFTPASGPTLDTEEVTQVPIAYWRLDEGTGTTAYDSISNTNEVAIGSDYSTSDYRSSATYGDQVTGITSDSDYYYLAAWEDNTGASSYEGEYTIQKMAKATGAVEWTQVYTTGAYSRAYDIVEDGDYLYTCGGYNYMINWRYERRLKSTGAVSWEVNNDPLSNGHWGKGCNDLAQDSTYIYGAGNLKMSSTNHEWRIEKRAKSNGALSQSRLSDPTTVQDWAYGIEVDADYVYVSGTQNSSDYAWRIEKLNIADLTLVTSDTWNPSAGADYLFDMTQSGDYIYLVGDNGVNAVVQKRAKSDLSIVYTTVSTARRYYDVKAVGNRLHLVGYNVNATSGEAIYEIRDMDSGDLIASYANDYNATAGKTDLFNAVEVSGNQAFLGGYTTNTQTEWLIDQVTIPVPDNTDATINSATWQTQDMCISNNCLLFDGTSSYTSIVKPIPNIKTVSFWVKPASTTEYLLDLSRGNIYVSASSGTLSATGITSPTIYVNGVQSSVIEANKWQYVTVTTDTSFTGASITLGKVSSNYLQGFMDELKIYNYARTAAEIKQDYLKGSSKAGSSVVLSANVVHGYNLSNGLVGYWPMDETAANSCTGGVNDSCDKSGNSNDGAWNDNATFIGGKFGNGVSLAGTTDHINMGDPSSGALDFGTGDFTLSTWFYKSSFTGNWEAIINKQAWGNGPGYGISISDNNRISADIQGSGGSNQHAYLGNDTVITTGKWYHVAAVFDRDLEIKLYLNGVLVRSEAYASGNTNTVDNALNLTIGRYVGGDYEFTGTIDETRLYSRALSPAEVKALYKWAPRPVGHWKMDENTGTASTYDSSGNGYTGTLTSMTESSWVPGKFGSALNFDGSASIVNLGDILDSNSSMSWGAWFNANAFGNTGILAKRDDATEYTQYQISSSSSLLYCLQTSSGAGWETNVSVAVPSTGSWHYVMCTNDGTTARMYLDGVQVGTPDSSPATSLAASAESLKIGYGRVASADRYFNGLIDDVSIYNYARTQEQIIEDMNAGHPAIGTPIGAAIAEWNFDEGYGTTAYDKSPNTNNLTLSAASWTNSGKFGKAWNGDGIVNLTRADDADFDVTATDDYSVSLWFKSDSASNPGAVEYIVDKESNSAGYAVYANTSGYLCFGIDDDATWGPDIASCTTTDFYDNTWHHLSAVRDYSGPDKTLIYIDGILRDSDSDSTTATLANSVALYLGDRDGTNNGDEFNGDIDEVNIYRFALSADNVKTLYNQGKAIVLGATSTDSSNNPSWSATNEYCPPGQGSACTGPVAEWKMDENTGTSTTYDTSGNNNTGTLNGSWTENDWVPGKYGSALNFDAGDSDRINPASLPLSDTAYSVSAWIKGNNNGGSIFAQRSSSSSNPIMGQLYLPSSKIAFITRNNTGGNSALATGTTTLAANTWYHVVGVRNGSNVYVYLNGVLEGTDNDAGGTISTNTVDIGRYNYAGSPGGYFVGDIDQVRIYNYARTQAQIVWEYNKGKPIGHWKLDECQGNIAYDFAPNSDNGFMGNNGTITIGASGTNTSAGTCSGSAGEAWKDGATGKRNASLELDGTDDIISVGTNNLFNLTGNFSITGWFKRATTSSWSAIVERYATTTPWAGYAIRINNTDNMCVWTGGASGTWLCTTQTYTDTNWHQVALVWNGTTRTIFIDGINVKSDSQAASLSNSGDTLYIGSLSGAGSYFNGQLDEVKIFNYALTPQQIKLDYNLGAVRFD